MSTTKKRWWLDRWRWWLVASTMVGCGTPDQVIVPPPPPPSTPPIVALRTATEGLTDATLFAAYTDSEGDAWIGTSVGTVLRLDDGRWRMEALPGGGLVVGFWGGEDSRLLAAAGYRVIRRSAEGDWGFPPFPDPAGLLLDFWGLSSTDYWVTGANGVILRHSAAGWSEGVSGVTEEIWRIGGRAIDDLVAVGQNGVILESGDGGGTWNSRTPLTDRTLFGVAADAAGRVVAVGGGGTVLVRDGTQWRQVTSPTSYNLFEVRSEGPGRFIIVGDGGTILQGDGDAWQAADVAGARENLRAVTGSPGHRRAVGWSGTILNEASGWGTELGGGALYGLHLPPGGGGLAVGMGGLAYAEVDGAWIPTTLRSPASLYDVAGPSASDRIAVGDSGTILWQHAGTWTREYVATGALLRAVWYDGVHAMAVGRGGTVLVREGGGWRSLTSGTSRFLRRVAGNRWDKLYIVGDSGTVLRWDGRALTPLAVGTEANLRGVDPHDEKDVWIVGDNGTILRGEGSVWRPVLSPTLSSIRDIREIGGRRYIAGERRQLFRRESEGWSAIGAESDGFWLRLAGDSTLVVIGELGRIDVGVH